MSKSKRSVSVSVSGKVAAKAAFFTGLHYGAAYGPDCPYKVGDVVEVQAATIGAIQGANTRQASFGNPLCDWKAVDAGVNDDGTTKWEKITPKEGEDGVSRFFRMGWNTGKRNLTAYYIGDNPDSQDLVRLERQRVYEAYMAAGETEIATAYQSFYAGQPIEWLVIDGNRSLRAIVGVVAWRIGQGLADCFNYPVRVAVQAVPADEKARLLAGLEANTDVGRKFTTSQDILAFVARLLAIDPNTTQNDLIRRGIKKGEAQRCFHLAKLARQYPSLNLIARLCMTPQPGKDDAKGGPGCFIPLAKLDHVTATRLASNRLPGTKKEGEDTLIPGGMSAKWLENYVQGLARGDAGAKRYTITDLLQAFTTHPCRMLRDWGKAIASGNGPAFVDSLVEYAELIDEATGYEAEPSETDETEETSN